jgi:hypothetical protein
MTVWAAGAGLATGGLTRGALAYVKNEGDKLFYGVWAGGMLFRLAALGAVFSFLHLHPALPFLPSLAAFFVAQFAVQLIPIRSRNSWT